MKIPRPRLSFRAHRRNAWRARRKLAHAAGTSNHWSGANTRYDGVQPKPSWDWRKSDARARIEAEPTSYQIKQAWKAVRRNLRQIAVQKTRKRIP